MDDFYDAVVIGYGPVGATMANFLGRDGHRTAVIERDREIFPLPRAIAFDHEVMRIFQSIGLAERVLPHSQQYRRTVYLGAQGQPIRIIEPSPPPFPYSWNANYTFYQPGLESVLRQGAEERDPVDVFLCHELETIDQTDDVVSLSVRDLETGNVHKIQADYVFAADGATGPSRRLLGIGMEDLEFDEQWIVIDAVIEDPDKFPGHHIQYCEPSRPSTYVVGPKNHRRWELMLLPGETPEDISDPKRVEELLSRWGSPADIEVTRSAVYRFHALVADDWQAGRVFLLGDAAHQTPPFMGQGMCQGIRDAANLAWKLDRISRHGAPASLFASYTAERKPHVKALTELTKRIGVEICMQDEIAAAERDTRLEAEMESRGRVTNRQSLIPTLISGMIDLDAEGRPRGIAGQNFFQPNVEREDGSRCFMDDAASGFRILVQDLEILAGLSEVDRAYWAGISGSLILSGERSNQAFGNVIFVRDLDASLADYFDRQGYVAVVVRPDHYVYGAAETPRDVNRLIGDIRRWLS